MSWVQPVEIVDQHQIDDFHPKLVEGGLKLDLGGAKLPCYGGLGCDKEAVPLSYPLHQFADHHFRPAIDSGGVHHRAAQSHHFRQHLLEPGHVLRALRTILVRSQPDDRKPLAGGGDGLGEGRLLGLALRGGGDEWTQGQSRKGPGSATDNLSSG